jgi:hypothetical protein
LWATDSAETLPPKSSKASWADGSNGDAGSPQEGQHSSDVSSTAADHLAVREVVPEDVEIVTKNGRKHLLGKGSYGEVGSGISSELAQQLFFPIPQVYGMSFLAKDAWDFGCWRATVSPICCLSCIPLLWLPFTDR